MQRILIVEDEKPLREAFAYLLKSEGFIVASAEHGKAGLDRLANFEPDLILLDMLMPVMDGVAFLQSARILETHPRTKVILFSNLSDPMTASEAHDYGVTLTVLKADLAPNELISTVKKVLSSNE